MVGLLDALGIEIAPHLAKHIFITRLGQVGLDHLDGIGLGLVAGEPKLLRCPDPKQLVPP